MKEERYFYVPNAASSDVLPPEEAAHAVRVLRLSAGDEVCLMDGCGSFYKALISQADKHGCKYEIKERAEQVRCWSGHLHLAIAPTKMNERMEWLAEKALGKATTDYTEAALIYYQQGLSDEEVQARAETT